MTSEEPTSANLQAAGENDAELAMGAAQRQDAPTIVQPAISAPIAHHTATNAHDRITQPIPRIPAVGIPEAYGIPNPPTSPVPTTFGAPTRLKHQAPPPHERTHQPILPAATTPLKRRSRFIFAILAAIVLLLLTGSAGIAYWAFHRSDYTVDSCVVRTGDTAKPAGCQAKGAYVITKSVDGQEKCDPTQPVVILERKGKSDEILCLQPTKSGK